MTETIRILIADDHPIVRHGLGDMIRAEPEMELVGEAIDGDDAVFKAHLLQPDVILLDVIMPYKNGIEATKAIKAENPGIRILILTGLANSTQIFRAIKAGAAGCMLKGSSSQELLQAIRNTYQSELSPRAVVARKLIREFVSPNLLLIDGLLTKQEGNVLRLVVEGLSNREIGQELFISGRTAGNYVSTILSKLHLANRTQAAVYALREGVSSWEIDNSTPSS